MNSFPGNNTTMVSWRILRHFGIVFALQTIVEISRVLAANELGDSFLFRHVELIELLSFNSMEFNLSF